jgi:hypothetical protein
VYITAMSASRFVRVNERQQNRERALLVYPQLLISFDCGSNVNVDASKTNTDASISVSLPALSRRTLPLSWGQALGRHALSSSALCSSAFVLQ